LRLVSNSGKSAASLDAGEQDGEADCAAGTSAASRDALAD